MTFWRAFDEPYYSGTAAAVSLAAITKYDVMVNGRGYLLDLENPNAPKYGFDSIPLLKAMFLQDRGTQPIGEHSLNPDDYWRRSVDDWSAGSGQKYLDLSDSNNNQFYTSKGVNPWTKGQITLLDDTTRKVTSSNTNLVLAVAGTYLYVLDGSTLKQTQDILAGSLTSVTGTGGDTLSSPTDMTSDGFTVWLCDATRVHYTTRGGANFAKYHTVDHVATLIKTAKGRLFTANGATLYTHSGASGSAVATAYFTHPNSDWTWTAVEPGQDVIYFAGYSGTTSIIYAATIKSDGTALDVPIAVATLPLGELARALKAYFSVLVIGTDKGWRAAIVGGSSGQVTLGSLVSMTSPPKCFESQDRFIWYGFTNYDSTSTGLGRIDLSVFNDDIPAYASDLMATTSGVVLSVVTFQSVRVFAVSASGIWCESTNKVANGTINSGWMNYALADSKLAIKVNVQHRIGAGSYSLSVAVDDQLAQSVGNTVTTNAVAGSNAVIQLPQLQGRAYQVTWTLNRSGTDTTASPVIDRWTLMVEPQPERRAKFMVPILLHSSTMDRLGYPISFDAATERRRFFELMQDRNVVPFQDFEQSYNVIVDDFHWIPYELIGAQRNWDGTLAVELKVIS